MKKILPILLILALTAMACSISVDLTPEPSGATSIPGGGGGPTNVPATDVPLVPTIPAANVTCNEVSLYLPPALGDSYGCERIPEAYDPEMPPFANNPEFTRIMIHGYPLAGKFFEPQIEVYPVAHLIEITPAAVDDYNQLVGILNGTPPGESYLPFLPFLGAAQVFHAQDRMVAFHNGSGIRYLTEYAQYAAPVNNTDLFYTFQGISADGQYWISTRFPVNLPMLPADAMNPPNGLSWDEFSNNYMPYITDMTNQLNAQLAESYTPSLVMLDDLIASITIQP